MARRTRLGLAAAALVTGALLLNACSAGYVIRSAWYQAELLASRQPVDEVRRSGRLTPSQLAALDVIADAKAYGAEIGLSATRNYETIALKWKRTLWNVSACPRLSLAPRTWWFPVVGRVPYLGYFTEGEARAQEQRLAREGYDVHVRTSGAYSTLGWFKDPILPQMLSWDEFDLAETVLHELTHATVWIPGSVAFNESLASFVGEEAAFRYLAARHGESSPAHAAARRDSRDDERWRALLHGLCRDLDALYGDASLGDDEKLARKASLLATLPERVEAAGFEAPERFRRAAAHGQWNNARLAQFRTYNTHRDSFTALLDAQGGDLVAFLKAVRGAVAGARDPFAALDAAARGTKGP